MGAHVCENVLNRMGLLSSGLNLIPSLFGMCISFSLKMKMCIGWVTPTRMTIRTSFCILLLGQDNSIFCTHSLAGSQQNTFSFLVVSVVWKICHNLTLCDIIFLGPLEHLQQTLYSPLFSICREPQNKILLLQQLLFRLFTRSKCYSNSPYT